MSTLPAPPPRPGRFPLAPDVAGSPWLIPPPSEEPEAPPEEPQDG